jgi:hypothetical protein
MRNLEAQFLNVLDAPRKCDGADCHWPSIFIVSVPRDYITCLQKSVSEVIKQMTKIIVGRKEDEREMVKFRD